MWKLALLMGSAIASGAGGYFIGLRNGQSTCNAEQAQAARTITKTVIKQGEVTEKVRTIYVQGKERVHVVKEYVAEQARPLVESDGGQFASNRLVRVWNATASGDPIGTLAESSPGATDTAPSDVTVAQVGQAGLDNMVTYFDVANTLRACQGWIREQGMYP